MRTVDPVFMTGGTGYIGRAVIDALRERGHRVHALVQVVETPPAAGVRVVEVPEIRGSAARSARRD